MNIHHVIETLSDGSKVSNIVLSDGDASIVLHAITRSDASDLALAIVEAIEKYTVDSALLY